MCVCAYMCVSWGCLDCCSQRLTMHNVFSAGAIPERTAEAEAGVGESPGRSAGGGEETQRRGTIPRRPTSTWKQKHRLLLLCVSSVVSSFFYLLVQLTGEEDPRGDRDALKSIGFVKPADGDDCTASRKQRDRKM